MAQVTLLAWQALKLSREVGGLLGEGIAEWVLGQALAASNPRNYQEAETHFARSIEAFETSGAKLYLAQAYTSWGDLYVKQDNSKAGQEKYEKAKALLEAANLTQELEVLSNRMREVASRR